MIKVIATGLQTSFQDLGRYGFRKLGVPLSGAMDQYASLLANQLVGNKLTAVVIEFTITGPVLEFLETTEIAVTGAGFTPSVDGYSLPLNKRVKIDKGSVLSFGLAAHGVRGYIAVAGGFNVKEQLLCGSFHADVAAILKIERGAFLNFNQVEINIQENNASVHVNDDYLYTSTIQVFKGPDYKLLSQEDRKSILNGSFQVSGESNRMAYLLDCSVNFSVNEIVTSPVQPGTVQITPSGRVIILMRDAQTTGGYARIFQLTKVSINSLAQKRAGEKLSFELILQSN